MDPHTAPSSPRPAPPARPVELRVSLASKIFAANLLTVGASVALLRWVGSRGDECQRHAEARRVGRVGGPQHLHVDDVVEQCPHAGARR